jgi:hypothetical protein
LSFHDTLNIYYARIYQRTLVTSSKCLRSACMNDDVKTISYQEFLEEFA